MNCRSCAAPLEHVFMVLGHAPPSNAYLTREALSRPEVTYPLRALVCDRCWLVQTEDFARAEDLFTNDYAYFSSTSTSFVAHAAAYVDAISRRHSLGPESHVVEVASNDGYLLRHFLARGVPCLGIEPTASTAAVAEALGIPVKRVFFGEQTAQSLVDEGLSADLIVANNVYGHVPDINDFTRGIRTALRPGGTVTIEFPHLLQLIREVQFDTIYHEHFSYLSLTAITRIFEAAGLRIYDVEELRTHGGSLRIHGCRSEDAHEQLPVVDRILGEEREGGLCSLAIYKTFQSRAEAIKLDLLSFLIEAKRSGKRIAAYGAAAQGNTSLTFAGV
jgi:SAM-dependent methyltransferase